ncbi:MAG: hypothetical protein PHQ47_01390 [Candidatus Portnoybacteria bacterium]|nr:hypothetical protein [Candidatus Portnoybacteria bacterium]
MKTKRMNVLKLSAEPEASSKNNPIVQLAKILKFFLYALVLAACIPLFYWESVFLLSLPVLWASIIGGFLSVLNCLIIYPILMMQNVLNRRKNDHSKIMATCKEVDRSFSDRNMLYDKKQPNPGEKGNLVELSQFRLKRSSPN